MLNIIETNLEFNAMKERKSTNRIILHNSGTTVRQVIEIIHNYHKNTNKWAGIGYHFYVRTDGAIYRGRPEQFVGAHAGGNNSDSIGICFEGDFNQETMSEVQMKAGQELVAYLKQRYGISLVQKHSDVCNTSCPGANFPFKQIANVQVSGENISDNIQSTEDKKDVIKRLQIALNSVCKSNLAVDGIIGNNTKNVLRKVALKNYCANELVRFVQDRLVNHKHYSIGNSGIDGKYGTATEVAVRNFQGDNGLKVDGIVGIATINLLV